MLTLVAASSSNAFHAQVRASSGYRSIVIYRKDDKAFFVFGFPKNAQGNIRNDEEDQFKKAAKITLALTDEQICLLIANGQFEEVSRDD